MRNENTKEKRSGSVNGNAGIPTASGKSSIKRLTFGSLLVLLFLLLYIPSLLNWLSGGTISSDIIRIGTIEESVSINGLIVRNEELVKAPPFDGRYIAEIGEGEKTPAFACIATVLNSRSDSLLKELEAINAKIVKAQMEKAEKADFFSEDLEKLDEEIGLRVQDLIAACNTRSFDEMGQYRREIDQIVEKKAEIIGENSTDSYVENLKKQKTVLQDRLNLNTVKIVSNASGIVSYVIDGFENSLKPDSLKKLTPEQFDSFLEKCRNRQEGDGMAHAGKPLAKIIKGTDIYIVAAVRTESLKNIKQDDRVKLRINGKNLETGGVVDYIGKPVDGRSIISVKTNRGADVLSASREVDADIISNTEEGLKVPLQCLRNFSKDGAAADIMLIKANVATKRRVQIISKDKEFAIIATPEEEMKKAVKLRKTVNLYDTYILYPDRVKEGDIVQK